MADFTDYLENALLNHVFRNTALTSPTDVYVALFTAAPDETGGGTEVSGNDYARIAAAFDAPTADATDATRQAILNSADLLFQTTHDPVVSVVAFGIYDASTLGNLLIWNSITATDLGVGAEIKFPVGNLKVHLS